MADLEIKIPDYTKEDFINTTVPYDYVYKYKDNPFLHDRVKNMMSDYAASLGIKGFKSTYSSYLVTAKRDIVSKNSNSKFRYIYGDNFTEFEGQKIELSCGNYICDDFTGISTSDNTIICPHPVMPIERLINIDTNNHKLKIAYYLGKRWATTVVDKVELASPTKIINLASKGIAVNSENAKALIKFFTDVEHLNYDIIPERYSVSRLGYINDGFSPYVDDIEFDGDGNFRTLYNSVSQKGDFEKWKTVAKKCRKEAIAAKILIAASFASVLVKKCDALPFFVHLWGVDSGTGKTVGLMLAASVWGNPERGQYVQTFNSTEVGQERLAAFLNDLPIAIDELQLARDKRGGKTFNVYNLAQGTGRTRGNKSGGVDLTPTWSNCILTTGESPLASYSDGAGAVNRVIEIECKVDQKVIYDGVGVSAAIKRNYGHAGRDFIEKLMDNPETFEMMMARYQKMQSEIQDNDVTEKQAMAAALILIADEMACTWYFDDENPLTFDELKPFLKSQTAVSLGKRGYEFICDWVSQNSNRFRTGDENNGDIYGVIETDKNGREWAYINAKKFREAVEDVNINSQSLLSWLKTKCLIIYDKEHNTKSKRLNGIVTRCVVVQLLSEEFVDIDEVEEIPF